MLKLGAQSMTVTLRRLFLTTAAAAALGAAALTPAHAPPRGFTAKDMVMLDRVSAPQASPDGRWVVYDVRSTDWDANKGVHSLWLLDTQAKDPAPHRLAISDGGVGDAQWSHDGRYIYFV